MKFDQRVQQRVSALTKKVATPVTFYRRTLTSGPNPSVSSTRSYTASARIIHYRASQIDGTLIKIGDILLRVPAMDLGIAPREDDRVLVDGQTREVVSVTPAYIATTVAFYDVQVR